MIENREAEQAVIGAILIEGELIKECTLHPGVFFHPAHIAIFKAMKRISSSDNEVDMVTLATELADGLEQIGGITYLTDLANAVPTTANFHHYERLILEAFRMRKSIELATKYAEEPSEGALYELSEKLTKLKDFCVVDEEKTIQQLVLEIAEDINGGKDTSTSGNPTKYYDFDKMTGGTQPTDLIIVAARPSMGKTAFALNIGGNHCSNDGTSHIFSLEMGGKQLVQRVISTVGNINGANWRDPSKLFGDEDYNRAIKAIGIISKWDLRIYEKDRTVGDICSRIRRAVKKEPNKKHQVIIDYLQLVSAGRRYDRRDLEIGAISRELKLLAKDLNIPIILLSQLSRGVESRQDKRPMMSDIRESGNVEQDADVICFLYRDDYYDRESEKKDIIEVIIAKQRNGPTGTVELAFVKEYGSFVNLDRRFEKSEVCDVT